MFVDRKNTQIEITTSNINEIQEQNKSQHMITNPTRVEDQAATIMNAKITT